MEISDGLVAIFQKGVNEWGKYHSFAVNDPTQLSIAELGEKFLEDKLNEGAIKDYGVETVSFDCGPSSEPGACFFYWLTNDNTLDSMTYEWNAC